MIAPWESCIGCLKGDTDTGFGVRGTAEFHAAALNRLGGLPLDEAMGTVVVGAEMEHGCDPGNVPAGTYDVVYRLCRECADRTGARVVPLAEGASIPTYADPEGGDESGAA